MRREFHPQIVSDISEVVRYYEEIAGPQLADDFYRELQVAFRKAADAPESFGVRERELRRANLDRFPYHFLFRIVANDTVRILVVRHHKRHPAIGSARR